MFINDRNYVNFGYMNDDEHTFAHLARQAGYSTAVVGKWQLGRSREMVGKLGFDEWCLTQLQIYKELAGERATDRYAFSYVDDNGHYEFSYYAPDDFQRYAFEYIDRQTEAGKPFLLYYPTPLVHTPHVATPDSSAGPTIRTHGSGKTPAIFRTWSPISTSRSDSWWRNSKNAASGTIRS